MNSRNKSLVALMAATVLMSGGAGSALAHADHEEAAPGATAPASNAQTGVPMTVPRQTDGPTGAGEGARRTMNLTVPDVWAMLQQRLARDGNRNLRVGRVVEKDDGTIVADVEAAGGALVKRYRIDRRGDTWEVIR